MRAVSFPIKNYQFSGGLHGWGSRWSTPCQNAWRSTCVATVRSTASPLKMVKSGRPARHRHLRQTQYRDQRPFLAGRKLLRQPALFRFTSDPPVKAKAVLCPGVEIVFRDQVNNSEQSWCYADGLNDYLSEAVNGLPLLPEKPFVGAFSGRDGGGGLGAAVAAGRRRTADRELREPDPDYAGRDAR